MMNELNHVAIIMDGNGRWATNQSMPRIKGHEEGASRVRDLTIYASKIKLKYLTLYAFSTENWKRPKVEVEFLMKLMDRWLKNELPLYLENDVKFETIGDLSKLSPYLQKTIAKTKQLTANNMGLTQVIAINYGSRDEIMRAINKAKVEEIEISEYNFGNFLDTNGMPDVDILIRTGGEKRLSNFLLWQIAYSELFFVDTLWPSFNAQEFQSIIDKYLKIHRRFGGI